MTEARGVAPLTLRVIDYVGNGGGGLRFTVETLKGLAGINAPFNCQLVSHGAALQAYRELLNREHVACEFLDIAPDVGPHAWHFTIRETAVEGADVIWLPWVHRHRMSAQFTRTTVGSFHDAIILTEPSLQRPFKHVIPDEWETTRRWLSSSARLVVSSRATVSTMVSAASAAPDRFVVVPTSGAHIDGSADPCLPSEWEWARGEYMLYPANITEHKNHELLFAAYSLWGQKKKLVLTGSAADLPVSNNRFKRLARSWLEPLGLVEPNRSTSLRRFAARQGLRLGDSLVPVGYVPDRTYYALLHQAWALVMPTLAEGGGSFPAEEAVRAGIPVISSDIPVMREHMARIGASVLWFDPKSPQSLVDALDELERDYARLSQHAMAQVADLDRRTWMDVAREYLVLFTEAVSAGRDNRSFPEENCGNHK